MSSIAGTSGRPAQPRLARPVSASLTIPWRFAVGGLVVLILLVPIRRYTLPARLPFELEPYRLYVIVLILGWLAALLVDRGVRARRSGFEGPVYLILFAILASIALNTSRIADTHVQQDVLKSFTFFLSFVLVFYVVVSVVRTPSEIDFVVKLLVVGGVLVAASAVYEWRTGVNVFNDLRSVFPFLQVNVVPDPHADFSGFARGGRLRVFASAQHPIALGAALTMLLPLALYLAQKERGGRRWLWLLAALVLMLGAQATISRTFAIMAIVIGIVYLLLRPRETIRFWPAIIPLLIVVHFALPNTLGILKRSLLPSGGVKTLIAEQGGRDFNPDQHGRIAKIDPTLEKISPDPLFGVGYGTQVLEKPQTNALILDDQWLGTLLESGLVGALGWLWLFALFVTRLGREARRDTSDRGSLLVAACAAIAAFAASMFLYDAFAFIQVTFLLFIMFGIGAVALAQRPGTGEERAVAGGPGRPT